MSEMTAEVCAVLDRAKKEGAIQTNLGVPPSEARVLRSKRPEWLELEKREMASVVNRTIPGAGGPIPIRIYTPKKGIEGRRPICLFFHCGGFMFGNLDSDDSHCRRIADEASCIMVSVDYRLAPENKFPAAYEDAIAAWIWVSTHAKEIGGDGKRFGVSGASAGGNLTAGVCHYARDHGGPAITYQLIFVGAFNIHPLVPSQLRRTHGGSDGSYAEMVRNAYRNSEKDREDIRYAPLIATDLRGFPPATIVVADCDAFYDEGLMYAEKLRNAGIQVEVIIAKGQVHHVFPWAGAFAEGRGLLDRGAATLRLAMEINSAAST